MVLFHGHQQSLRNQVGQRGGTGSPWVAKDYFHAVGRGCIGHVTDGDGQLLEVGLHTHMEEHELCDPFFGFGFLIEFAG